MLSPLNMFAIPLPGPRRAPAGGALLPAEVGFAPCARRNFCKRVFFAGRSLNRRDACQGTAMFRMWPGVQTPCSGVSSQPSSTALVYYGTEKLSEATARNER